MVALTASFDADSEQATTVETAAELDAVLDTVAGWEGRIIVQLRIARPVDTTARRLGLYVGVHGTAGTGTLLHTSPAGVVFSKATPGPDWIPAERILYYYLNNDTEYPQDSEIPLDTVRSATHEYMNNGGHRPDGPTWQSPPEWYPTAH
ncbi:Imm1 family immunity protein [Saccharothrix lopnurensis]|uniref:Imm1 family immunity protein n=1 Tax=Saccharothrix lopnurensis TaxID=1670621 RepID=A0ABW1PFL9_9PSEU